MSERPKVRYSDTMTMREARRIYFEANGLGETGGYDEPWVDFKLGPIPFPFPNTASRVRAVGYHDVHHVITEYSTDIVGEFEISAWEIGAGCKTFAAAWVLNLGGMVGGLVRAPKRTFLAFVRGRRSRTAYGARLDALLEEQVGDLRQRHLPTGELKASGSDVVLFGLALAAGLVVAVVTFVLVVPLVPIGLVSHALRRRRARSAV